MFEGPIVDAIPKVVLRGWRNICPFLGLKNYRAARKHLEALGILYYESRRPVLSIDAYRRALLRVTNGEKTGTDE